jgi:hypothetical protein
LTLTRNAAQTVTKIAASGSGEWKYTYNSTNRLAEYLGPEGASAKYDYYSSGPLKDIVDPAGTVVMVYDSSKRVTSVRRLVNGTIEQTGSQDEMTSFEYGNGSTAVKYPTGFQQTYSYDAVGNLLEDTETQLAAGEFYAGYAGVGPGEANTAVVLQDRASILDSQVAQQLGSSYVGEWFDPSSGRVKIGIGPGGYEQTVRQDLYNLGLVTHADVVSEPASWSQLTAAESSLNSRLATIIEQGRVATGLRPSADAVTVEKANSLSAPQRQEVSEAVAALSVPSRVIETNAASVAGKQTGCSGGSCTPPLRGGVRIESEVGTGCTAGFIARSIHDKKPYVLTAGHCVAHAGIGTAWNAFSPELGTQLEHKIGTGHSFVNGSEQSIPGGTTSKGDAGLIGISSGSFWARPLEPLVIVYGSSGAGTTRNERYGIMGTKYNPQNAQHEFVVCAGGVTQEHGNVASEACGNHFAYGILSGITEPCGALYEGINTAEHVLHVEILRGPQ